MGKLLKIFSKNAAYQKLEVLKTNRPKRTHYGEFIIEGVRNINEAVRNDWKIVSWIFPAGTQLSDWAMNYINNVQADEHMMLSPELMSELSGKSDTSELMAVAKMADNSLDNFKPNSLAALFDRPSNRGNLGTIIRSCDAFGIEGLIVTGHGVDLYDPETITATMGSFFNIKTAKPESNQELLDWIKNSGLQVIATTAHKEKPISEIDFTIPTLILIGNETEGLANFLYEISDVKTTIPMAESSSASSFNVACAASIVFYEAVRQRYGTN
jgi:rRNA methylases